jgi:glycosyltransferase involved in cell wall biosynthesis
VTTNIGKTIFVHATNVHSGGGRSLLHALLQTVPADCTIFALLDIRMPVPVKLPANLTIRLVLPSIWQRLKAEWWLSRTTRPSDLVLCFGNLPPLFQLRGRAFVFLQNRYLIDPINLQGFPLKTRLRLEVERLWFSRRARNAHAFIVQTPSMQALLESSGKVTGKPVHILPFVNASEGYERVVSSPAPRVTMQDFIYVASGEPHKNHRRLIEAWSLLAKDGLYPYLWLTLDAGIHPELCAWMAQQKERGKLRVENLGVQSHEEILRLYARVGALIYPSVFESFGIPLIEARQAGLAVVASELDFVRDVLDPEQVFDPQSPVSIARAVKRFMGASEEALPLLNAAEFMKSLLEKCE